MAAHSMFAGIKDATQSRGLRQLDVGSYVVEIERLRSFKSSKDGLQVFIADLSVLESDNPAFKVGDKVGYVVKQGKYLQYFLADVKSFIAAAAHIDEGEVDEETADLCVAQDGKGLKGHKMRCIVEVNPKDERYRIQRFLPHTGS